MMKLAALAFYHVYHECTLATQTWHIYEGLIVNRSLSDNMQLEDIVFW